MRALSLFSGIAGLDRAAHAAGIETVAFCEIEPFAVQVLERRFPAVENHGDITRFTNRTLRELGGSPFHRFKCPADYNGTIDVVHGGFPCQDLSVAGKQRGLSGERSGLWFEMLRVVSELRPAYVLAENVRGACNLALPTVVAGLEGEGYEVRASVVPASAFGAPHRRERLFVLGVRRDVADAFNERLQGSERAGALCKEGEAAYEPASECGEGGLCPTPSVHGNYNRKGLSENSGDGLATAVKMWRTPDASCGERGTHSPEGLRKRMERGMPLRINDQVAEAERSVKLWPTPRGRDANAEGFASGLNRDSPTLPTVVKLWATPSASSATIQDMEQAKFSGNDPNRPKYSEVKSVGSLNPAWVEILMGYPLGWTDIDCDEPEPWPGWPMGLWAGNWPTPQCFDATAGDLKGKEYTGENRHALKLGNCINSQTGQYPYEPPRTCTGIPHRAKRLKALGNSVVPAQAYPFFEAIAIMEEVRQCNTASST